MCDFLTINNIVKKYKQGLNEITALDDFSLVMKKDEKISIMGKSGAGKTTLLKIIGALLPPTTGNVLFKGEDIYKKSINERCFFRRQKIGFVFQTYELIPELNVYENIIFPLLLDKKSIDRDYLASICKDLYIQDKVKRYPAELSGGEQQRVAIARALINKPELLLCDEPTGNLDEATSTEVMEMLDSIHKTYLTAMLIVTHDTDVAQHADRIITLK